LLLENIGSEMEMVKSKQTGFQSLIMLRIKPNHSLSWLLAYLFQISNREQYIEEVLVTSDE